MLCPKCAKAIPDDALICCYCGKKLTKEKRTGKRANRTGSVYYDSRANCWVAQFVTDKRITDDKKVRFSYKRKNCKSRTEALKVVQSLETVKEARPDFTVAYYYNSFVNGKGEKLSYDKKLAYRVAFKRLEKLHNTPVKDLTIADMQEAINAAEVAFYPARDMRTLLNKIFKMAVAQDRGINPALPSMLELPALEEEEVEPFTEEEQLMLWYSYEAGNTDAAIPLIMIYTGLMTGELRKITRDMVHLDQKYIGKDVGLKTKERKSKTVILPDDIIPVVEDVMAKGTTEKLFPMYEKKFYELYYSALKEAGIARHLTPYSCRHTTATVLAVHENVAPQTLQRVMRWKSTRMMDRYVTPSDSDARKAINKI